MPSLLILAAGVFQDPSLALREAIAAVLLNLFENLIDRRFSVILSRFRIVVEKWLGSIWVALPAILIGLLVACLILFRDQASDYQRVIVSALVASAIGICAYCGIFLLISLLIQRALLAGIIYTFVIENVLGRYLKGLRVVSIQHYVKSIYEQLQNNPAAVSSHAASLSTAIIVLVSATAIALLLATWRLTRMSLD